MIAQRKPKFKIGTRVVVTDYNTIADYGGYVPLVGWVVGYDYQSHNVLVQCDDLNREPVHYHEDHLDVVRLRRYGRQIRNSASIDCPWCLKHGRNDTYFDGDMHIPCESADVCGCWHHTHAEHMPECPFR